MSSRAFSSPSKKNLWCIDASDIESTLTFQTSTKLPVAARLISLSARFESNPLLDEEYAMDTYLTEDEKLWVPWAPVKE